MSYYNATDYCHGGLTESLDYFSLSVDTISMRCFDRNLFSDHSHSVPKSLQVDEKVGDYSPDE